MKKILVLLVLLSIGSINCDVANAVERLGVDGYRNYDFGQIINRKTFIELSHPDEKYLNYNYFAENGTDVNIFHYSRYGQDWNIYHYFDDFVIIYASDTDDYEDLCLNVYATAAHNNTDVTLWDCYPPNSTKQWILEFVGYTSYPFSTSNLKPIFVIRSKNNRNFVLTAKGTYDKADVRLAPYSPGNKAQHWIFDTLDNDDYD